RPELFQGCVVARVFILEYNYDQQCLGDKGGTQRGCLRIMLPRARDSQGYRIFIVTAGAGASNYSRESWCGKR
ncbi:hypothetical protein BGZ82_008398, partial [Podila clonocystis]